MVFIIIAIVIVVTFFLYDHFTKYNDYWKKRNVPGPKPTFFFGNIKDLVLRRRAGGEIFSEICDKFPEEKVIGIFRMRTPELLINDLDVIKHILIKNFEVFVDRGVAFSEEDLGANLFHANADTWQVLRSRFTPLFTSGKLKNMMHLITEIGDRWVDYVTQATETQSEQEFHSLAKKFTQSSIAACAFGIDIESFDDELSSTLQNLDSKIFNNSYNNELEMIYPGILKRFGASLFPKEVKDFFFGLTKNIIAQRNGESTNRNDFMDLILALRQAKRITGPKRVSHDESEQVVEMTDEIIAAQSFIFFVAGNETSACTLGYMLHLLAMHPDIQDKVVTELEQVLQNHGELTFQAVADLKYMEKVFNETLRLRLVAETVRRRAKIDYRIPGTDVIVTKEQIVIIPINVIHMDPKYYPNPEVFDPERFSPEQTAARHSCAYLPFGLGPRQCIGSRFARLQTKICVAKLLSKFRVFTSKYTHKEVKYVPARLVQMPIGGFPLKLVRRRK